jgi:hypothetical protein
MTSDELDRSLRQLRLGGMAGALSLRSQQARAESLGPLDFISLPAHDEPQRRRDPPSPTPCQSCRLSRRQNARHVRLEIQRCRSSAHI